MNKKDLINRCLLNKDALETYPFKDEKYGKTPVLRHKSNNKWFALIFEMQDTLYINLKAEPETVFILKEQYPDFIKSAWHMNKVHWYKIDVNKADADLLQRLIKISFDITAPKKKTKTK